MPSSTKKTPFDLSKCARPNILALQPYRCARDDYADDGTNILLDANENAFGPAIPTHSFAPADAQGSQGSPRASFDLSTLHRYPDPHQHELKRSLCRLRNTHHHTAKDLSVDNLFVGVGSDEAIDALLRCFCRPGQDRIVTCPPTYGMYSVSAQVNDVAILECPLSLPQKDRTQVNDTKISSPGRIKSDPFHLRVDAISHLLSTESNIKLVYICSPGNPTGTRLRKSDIEQLLLHPTWNGIIIVDEAYIDFSPDGASLAEWVLEWPNLVVMQTLSKAFGMAGIRLGVAFASAPVAALLNNLKAPYNISAPTSALANAALQPDAISRMQAHRSAIQRQRDRLMQELPQIAGIGRVLGGLDANFLLVEVLNRPTCQPIKTQDESFDVSKSLANGSSDTLSLPCNETALAVYNRLAKERSVVVRFRGREKGCAGCLRITIGTESEMSILLQRIQEVLREIYGTRTMQRSNKSDMHPATSPPPLPFDNPDFLHGIASKEPSKGPSNELLQEQQANAIIA